MSAIPTEYELNEPPRSSPDERRLPPTALAFYVIVTGTAAAVAALGSAASTEAFEGLLGALAGAAPALRDRIAESLSKGARQQLFLRLDEIEKNASFDVRLGVAWTLGKCGAPACVPVLARFLRDQSAALRASAAGALAKIADQRGGGAIEAIAAAKTRSARALSAIRPSAAAICPLAIGVAMSSSLVSAM